MKCLQCNSTQILENVRVVDRGHGDARRDLKLEVYQDPDALIFKGAVPANVQANVCTDCGFVMFSVSVEDARNLKANKK